jgi:hypothetical protein
MRLNGPMTLSIGVSDQAAQGATQGRSGSSSWSLREQLMVAQGAAHGRSGSSSWSLRERSGGGVTNSPCAPGADHFPRRQFYRHLGYTLKSYIKALKKGLMPIYTPKLVFQ